MAHFSNIIKIDPDERSHHVRVEVHLLVVVFILVDVDLALEDLAHPARGLDQLELRVARRKPGDTVGSGIQGRLSANLKECSLY